MSPVELPKTGELPNLVAALIAGLATLTGRVGALEAQVAGNAREIAKLKERADRAARQLRGAQP